MIAWLAAVALASQGVGMLMSDLPAPGTQRESLAAEGFTCESRGGRETCRLQPAPGLAVDGVPALLAVLVYEAGRLTRATLVVDELRFSELENAIAQRLGPGEDHVELLRAGMGGLFPNHVTVWRSDGEVLLLEQYFERVTRSAITRMDEPEFDRFLAEREAQRVRGVRDL
ncbi:MAG: hypothetical protein WDZ63_07575 [Burkholderiales bacterium]